MHAEAWSSTESEDAAVAIVGIGCHLPGGADGPERFWRNLLEGVNGIVEVPPDRWNLEAFYDPRPGMPGRSVTKWGGFVDDVTGFDAQLFGISPREAAATDPQQRLVLQVVWQALENAGLAADRLAGSATGVFLGVCGSDYGALQRQRRTSDALTNTGVAVSIVANRVSHRLDLRGPSLAVDTACSSSLVAVHLACRSLRDGECGLALAGGVNMLLDPAPFIGFSAANMMSPTGRMHMFDARADGYVRGEGAGVVVLKPLADAIADGDRIYAVIRGTCVNQDGHTGTMTAPSPEAQVAMLRAACAHVGADPAEIAYVEAHGTGTPVGDPIEARAIGEAFGRSRPNGSRLLVGSVKTNVGHLESAAGVTGLIKTALALHHRVMPRNLHFERPNPNIPLDELGLRVPTETTPLRAANGRLYAAVNSFGFGGTNACAVVEAAPVAATGPVAGRMDEDTPARWLAPLSAATPTALAAVARQVAEHLTERPEAGIADVVGTLALRRAQLGHRLAVVARSRDELRERLLAFAAGQPAPSGEGVAPAWVTGKREPVQPLVFVFTGQGGQWWAMGRELLACDPVFRGEVERFDTLFREIAGWSVIEELQRDQASSRVDETRVTQPAIFAVQIGLAARWRAWGIAPTAVLGHSFGEVAASHVAGALTLEDAARVIHHRGRLQTTLEGTGAMAAVAAPAATIQALLAELGEERVEIAAFNGPGMTTLAGEPEALRGFLAAIEARQPGTFARLLKLQAAYHARGMDPIEAPFRASLGDLRPGPTRIPMVSTVTGAVIAGESLDADYWWRNVRLPVLFQPAVEHALEQGWRAFVELGPHATLSGLLNAVLAARGTSGIVVPSLHRDQPELDTLHAALGTLWTRGMAPDWTAVVGRNRGFVALPYYPFEKQRFWTDCEESRALLFEAPVHPLLGKRRNGPRPAWTNELDLVAHAFVKDHRIDGAVLFPATGYLEMMLAAAKDALGDGPLELEEVTVREAMFLAEDRSELVQTTFDPERSRVAIHSRTRDGGPEWTLRAAGRVRQRALTAPPADDGLGERPAGLPLDRETFYRHCQARRYEYGPLFQGIERVRAGDRLADGEAVLPDELTSTAGSYLFHPALFDACLQFGIAAAISLGTDGPEESGTYVPVGFERIRLYRKPGPRLRVTARVTSAGERAPEFDLTVADETGDVVLTIERFRCKRLGLRRTSGAASAVRPACYQDIWHEAALEAPAGKTVPAGTWLVFTDRAGLLQGAAAALRAAGHRCLKVVPGAAYEPVAADRIALRPDAKDDMQRLVAELAAATPPLAGILHGWSLDALVGDAAPDAEELLALQSTAGCLPVLHLVQSLAEQPKLAPRLWLVTQGVRRLGDPTLDAEAGDGRRLAQVPLAGLARTIATEHEAYRCTTVDLDPADPATGLAGLLVEITADGEEPEVAYRAGRRFVCRLERVQPEAIPPRIVPASEVAGFRLDMRQPGILDQMTVVEAERPEPAAGEIAVAVQAVGLNFRDIMAASGLLPEDAEEGEAWRSLGAECSGLVTAVGAGVTGLAPGDPIMSFGKDFLRSHRVMPAGAALPMPAGVGVVEAATIPIAFVTAWYALVTLGRMQPGERVLIHVATGGVGLAAVQIARLVGAEIFATAGSERKRDHLRGLGIRHVMNSRTLDFADEIMAATDGRGVDLVLNSLPGPFLEKGLEVLAPYGRFLELGKRDIYADHPLGLRVLRRNLSFFAIDVARLGIERGETMAGLMRELAPLFADGRLRPLPAEVFPISRVVDAFRHMSQAKHIGKVVVTLDDPGLRVALSPERPITLRADGSYLVTGGASGFGLAVARRLAEAGAGQLVLMSRSGAASEEARQAVEELRAGGVPVMVAAADVTRTADVTRVLAEIDASGKRLRGVVHAAMVLDDGFLTQLDATRFTRVLAPKMLGAWNLHVATRDLPLDLFVMFSSVAALLGSAGQGNYVAGNAFLDALALHRRALGLPALTINWGALGGAGFVARTETIARYLDALGIAALGQGEALAGLDRLLRQDPGTIALAKIDWSKLTRSSGVLAASPRLAHVAVAAGEGQGGGRLRAELLAASAARREAMLARYLRQQIAKVLRVEAAQIEAERPLGELGLDSLTAFELKNRVEGELAVSLPVSRFLQQPTVTGLGAAILEKLEAEPGPSETAAAAPATEADPLSARQAWLWSLYEPGGEITAFHRDYHLAYALAVRPRLDLARLRRAFDAVVARHPMLRTSFPEVNGGPVQAVADAHPLGIEVTDAQDLAEAAFRDVVQTRADEPFDLRSGPLFRLQLFRRPDDRDVLLLRMHHTVVDGWSVMLVLSEMFTTYFGATDPNARPEPPEPFQHADFARWQRAMLAGPEGAAHLDYWRRQLAEPGPLLELPFDRPRGPGPIREGGYRHFVTDAATAAGVRDLAVATGATFYTVLLGAYGVLLHGLTGRSDLPVTASATGRTRPEFEHIVGWLVNNVIFRSRVEPQASFREFLRDLSATVHQGLEHQDCPIHLVLDAVDPQRHDQPSCLDQVGFFMSRPDNFDDGGFGIILLNHEDARVSFGSLEVASFPVAATGCTRDLTLYVQEFDGRIYGSFNFDADLFDAATIDRLAADYQSVLRTAVADPDRPIAALVAGLAADPAVAAARAAE